MHICFLTHEYPKESFPHGGVGTFIRTLGRNLVASGIDVSVIGTNYSKRFEFENDEGVNIYRLPFRKFRGMTWFLSSRAVNKKLKELHKNKPIDIVESTELGLAFISKTKGVKYTIRLHGGHHFFSESEMRGINSWKSYQEKRSFRKADQIIGVSNYVLDHTAKYLNFIDKRGPAIYNPVDLLKFHSADPKKAIRGRIFFGGTVCEKKGVRQLILAMPLIREEVSEAHLVIAGRDWKFPDGSSYIDWIQQFIKERDRESISFLGSVDNNQIPALIEASEVCVFPSHMEAMPLAWLEVLAMGKAFVASRTGPGSEIIRDGETGLLCDPLNPRNIADKTLQILKNPSLGLKLGSEARKDVGRRFSVEMIIKQNIDFYQSLINE